MGVVAQEDDHFAACRSQCDKVLVFDRDSPAVRQINPEWLKGRRMARFPILSIFTVELILPKALCRKTQTRICPKRKSCLYPGKLGK